MVICKNTRITAALVILSILAVFYVISSPQNVKAAGTTYYVDSIGGNDSNNGTSASTAWQTLNKVNAVTFKPGDQILFKAGCSWTGTLSPKGSGTSGSPIVLDMYGTGGKPLINANGGTDTNAGIYMNNQQYWEIRNFEIINDSTTAGNRRGVYIRGQDCGDLNYFRLTNLTIHNVKGDNTFSGSGKATGGIYMTIYAPTATDANGKTYATGTPSRFNDVIISGCTVYNVDRTGIYVGTDWFRQTNNYNGTNVTITNNTVYSIGGDGIIVLGYNSPIIQYNVVHDANARSGSYAVGMFSFGCNDAIMQYNEVYLTRTTNDGEGFDIDYDNNRGIAQYNYSHDNEGGGFLVCMHGRSTDYNDGAIIRYNISQNDLFCGVTLGSVTNVSVYNNTFYIGAGLSPVIFRQPDADLNGATYRNNLIYNAGNGTYSVSKGTNVSIDYNCYYGYHDSSEPKDVHKVTTDPKLVNPGSGGTGINTVDGYKLSVGSSCINTGVAIANNGGKDYWGNALYNGAPDIGAYEYPDVLPTITPSPTPIPTPIILECENLFTTTSGAASSIQTEPSASGGKWVKLSSKAVGDWIQFVVNIPSAGTYDVQVTGKESTSRGIYQLYIDGRAQGSTVDEYSSSQQFTTKDLNNAVFNSSGSHTLKFQIVGKNPSSSGYDMGLDCINLTSIATPLVSISFGSFSPSMLNSYSDTRVTACFTAQNTTSTDKTLTIVLAEFTGTQNKFKIKTIVSKNVVISSGQTQQSINATITVHSGSFLKAFVWDMGNVSPVLLKPQVLM